MLPALQSKSHGTKLKEIFDVNFNKNNKGFTPLHRAILANNYKAIYLLLQSGTCNLLLKDHDFKSPRDYCQKILFLSKYLRKGENNYMN
jgi:ankyrin repeat protein